MLSVSVVIPHHLPSLQACEIYLNLPWTKVPGSLKNCIQECMQLQCQNCAHMQIFLCCRCKVWHIWIIWARRSLHCQCWRFGPNMCLFFLDSLWVRCMYSVAAALAKLCEICANLLKLFVGTSAIPTTLSAVVATKRWNLTLPPSWLAPTMVGTVFMASHSVKDGIWSKMESGQKWSLVKYGICQACCLYCHQNWSQAIWSALMH